MNDANEIAGEEQMDPRFHREMARLGWRVPKLEAEVREAEAFVAEFAGELPARLKDDVELPQPEAGVPRPEGLLARYLRDGGADGAPKGRQPEKPKGRMPERD